MALAWSTQLSTTRKREDWVPACSSPSVRRKEQTAIITQSKSASVSLAAALWASIRGWSRSSMAMFAAAFSSMARSRSRAYAPVRE